MRLWLTTLMLLAATFAVASPAGATPNQQDSLIYMPYGLIHSVRPASPVDGYLAEVDSYGIGQLVFAMPRFKRLGVLKVPKHNREVLVRWSDRAARMTPSTLPGCRSPPCTTARWRRRRTG